MEFSPTLLAIVPPLLAILLAVITRQVVLSLFIAVFVGAVMLCGGNLWEGFYSTFFDYILPGFEDTDHQRILALTTFCGGLSLLLEKNGGAQAFANAVSRGAGKTRRGAQVLTWLGGVFVWFSDSTNPVLVGPICRSFTDKVKVSREKLAYIVDSTTAASPLCSPSPPGALTSSASSPPSTPPPAIPAILRQTSWPASPISTTPSAPSSWCSSSPSPAGTTAP